MTDNQIQKVRDALDRTRAARVPVPKYTLTREEIAKSLKFVGRHRPAPRDVHDEDAYAAGLSDGFALAFELVEDVLKDQFEACLSA